MNKINEIYDIWKHKCIMNNLTHPNFLRLEQIPINYRKMWTIPSLKGIDDFNNLILSDLSIKYEHSKCLEFLDTCDKYQGINFKDVNLEIWEILNEYKNTY